LAVEGLAGTGLAPLVAAALGACFATRPDFEPGFDVSAGVAGDRFTDGFGRERGMLFLAREGRMILAMFGV